MNSKRSFYAVIFKGNARDLEELANAIKGLIPKNPKVKIVEETRSTLPLTIEILPTQKESRKRFQ